MLSLQRTAVVDEESVFSRFARKQMAQTLKLAAVSLDMGHAKISNHFLRAGGDSQMCAVGFEMATVKRRDRRISTTFRQYLWRGEHILSGISRGMFPNHRNHGRSGGKRTRYRSISDREALRRLVGISNCTSAALRHYSLP